MVQTKIMSIKKQLFFLNLLISFMATSCKRNWVCECQTTSTVVPVDIINTHKEEAKIACDKYNFGIYAQSGGCKLK